MLGYTRAEQQEVRKWFYERGGEGNEGLKNALLRGLQTTRDHPERKTVSTVDRYILKVALGLIRVTNVGESNKKKLARLYLEGLAIQKAEPLADQHIEPVRKRVLVLYGEDMTGIAHEVQRLLDDGVNIPVGWIPLAPGMGALLVEGEG